MNAERLDWKPLQLGEGIDGRSEGSSNRLGLGSKVTETEPSRTGKPWEYVREVVDRSAEAEQQRGEWNRLGDRIKMKSKKKMPSAPYCLLQRSSSSLSIYRGFDR
ncbi:unnamed protein product [Musa acuminata subsp. burmannicoides]